MSLTIRILLILVSLINVVLVRGNLQVISGDVSSSNSHFADSEESSRQRILNNIFPTTIDEQELVYSYNGVPCDECNEFYDGPCPLHVLKHVQARANIPFSYMHHRAARTAPKKILQLEESSIPGGGMGVYTVKKIPKGVVIGPLEGKIIIRDPRNNTNEPEYDLDGKKVNKEDCSADKGNYWQIPGSDNQYVDLLDKSKANFMAYINCARNNREENLIRYFNETDQKFYFKAKIVIPKYTELLVDYGPEFRKTIGINDVDYQRPRTLRKKIFLCKKCLRASYTPVGLMPNHYCPVPTKEEDLWSKVLQNKTIVQKEVRRHEKNNPKAFKTVYECNVCLTSKNATKQLNEKDMKMHFLRKHQNITEINPKTLIRDDFIQLNKLCHRYYKCNICANESAGLNWTKTEPRPKESLEFEEFVKMLSREQKKMKERARQEDSVNEMHDVLVNFDREEAPITEKLELTSLHMSNTSVTQKKYKINKKFFYKSRDALQCHFKTKHMPLVNITDVRVMKYRGAPHECSLCGNQTIREQLDIDHHVDYHLNFTEMFDGGLLQLDYRTKKFNAPYIENFNFSHLFCTRCNQYIDTNKSHEPEPHELLAHKLDHINLHILGYQDYVKRKTVQIGKRNPKLNLKQLVYHCYCGEFSSDDPQQMIFHIEHGHDLNPYNTSNVPHFLRDDPNKLLKSNTTPAFTELDLSSAINIEDED